MANGSVLEQMLELVGWCLGPETARALVELRIDPKTQTRDEELARKANEGQRSPSERSEYEAYIQAGTLISILQGKARRVLAHACKA